MNALLVSSNKIKAFTALHQNTDEALLSSGIALAQDLHLQPIIGGSGLTYLETIIINNKQNGTPIESWDRTLLDEYIAPFLIWASYYEILPELFARKGNAGITLPNGTQTSSVDIKGMEYYKSDARSKYQFYGQRLQDYLRLTPNSGALYPWYWSWNSLVSMPPTSQSYFSGLYLDGRDRKGYYSRLRGRIPTTINWEYYCC